MFIGIDLGGTNIAAGLVDESGKILASDSVPTGAERGSDAIISDMADLAKRIAEKNGQPAAAAQLTPSNECGRAMKTTGQ